MDKFILEPFEMELQETMGLTMASQTFVDRLRKQVLLKPKEKKLVTRRLIIGWVQIALVIILVLIFTVVGPERVVSAMRQWLGVYFQGIGFVDHSSLRVLEEPVKVEKNGVIVEIDWAYTNEQHLVIGYPVTKDPRPCKDWVVYSMDTLHSFRQMNSIKILYPDGQEVGLTPHGDYPPLPLSVDRVIVRLATSKDILDCPKDRSCRCMDTDQWMDIPIKFVIPANRDKLQIYDLQFTPVLPER